MAASLVDSLAADFDPSQYEDRYAGALEQLIEAKVSTGNTRSVPVPPGEEAGADGGGDVVDLLAALQRSVEKARGARGDAPTDEDEKEKPKAKAKKPKSDEDEPTPRKTRRKAS